MFFFQSKRAGQSLAKVDEEGSLSENEEDDVIYQVIPRPWEHSTYTWVGSLYLLFLNHI